MDTYNQIQNIIHTLKNGACVDFETAQAVFVKVRYNRRKDVKNNALWQAKFAEIGFWEKELEYYQTVQKINPQVDNFESEQIAEEEKKTSDTPKNSKKKSKKD